MLYCEYITKYHKIFQNAEIFFRIPKRAVLLISKNFWKFLMRQRMHSKNTIDDIKNKTTKNIKLRMKMLAGLHALQPIYLLDMQDMSSKLSCTLFTISKNLCFPSEKQTVRSFVASRQLVLLKE